MLTSKKQNTASGPSAAADEFILVLNFGSQYSQLIVRKLRALGVYSELAPHNVNLADYADKNLKGIVISGGPMSVFDAGAPKITDEVLNASVPVLGICYGMQSIVHQLGGSVVQNDARQYGHAKIEISGADDPLLQSLSSSSQVWMSHGDSVTALPDGFSVLAETEPKFAGGKAGAPIASIIKSERDMYGVQFHPEVHHTAEGAQILQNFVTNVCKCEANWGAGSFIEQATAKIKRTVGGSEVLCAVSGGVDSTVTAVVLQRSIADQLQCIFVDNGLLRAGEADSVRAELTELGINLTFVDAADEFLGALAGVTDPEQKRKIIGKTFIDVFEREAKKFKNVAFLAQGTLYSDVIESGGASSDQATTIKSHHNVGGLPEKLDLELIEPVRDLFKDEVRRLGAELGISPHYLDRHPFPGPGLAIRIIGEVTREKLDIVRVCDEVVKQELVKRGLYDDPKLWQAFAILTDTYSVGVMGDARSYGHVVALRMVESQDAMTASWAKIPSAALEAISSRIVNEAPKVTRVVLDITNKPPGTIEWE